MFLHLSVSHSVHRGCVCLSACWDIHTSPGADPRSRHPSCAVHAGRYGQQAGSTCILVSNKIWSGSNHTEWSNTKKNLVHRNLDMFEWMWFPKCHTHYIMFVNEYLRESLWSDPRPKLMFSFYWVIRPMASFLKVTTRASKSRSTTQMETAILLWIQFMTICDDVIYSSPSVTFLPGQLQQMRNPCNNT